MTTHSDSCAVRVDAATLKTMLAGREEFALLDVRETGTFSSGHIFYSVSLPLSHLETRLAALVPNRHTRLVLVDAESESLAERAAAQLVRWGYTNLVILDGGIHGWQNAGYQLYSGLYVPNKAFGEFIEHHYHTPEIDAATLAAWRTQGKDMVILDSRPFEEYRQFSIPGGINCPGAELVHRAFGLVKRPDTTIVVNCAGRTRGIIGVQSLINAGIPNPVVTLKNGTAGWYLNGNKLDEGASAVAPPPDHAGLQQAITASKQVAKRFRVQEIDMATLRTYLADTTRTTFVLDVRTPEEYAAGHLPEARCAPGGQVVQSIDHYIGVRNARIVLVDDNGVRANMTASWLVQFGWPEVYVLRGGLAGSTALVHGKEPALFIEPPPAVPAVSVVEASQYLEAQSAVFIDVSDSLTYRRGHIPGAWFAIRSRLRPDLTPLLENKPVIVISPDGRFAAYAAKDIQALTTQPVHVLAGGMRAWQAAGLVQTSGFEKLADKTDDVWYGPYDFDDLEQSMNAYLSWEIGLVAQLQKEDRIDFLTPAA